MLIIMSKVNSKLKLGKLIVAFYLCRMIIRIRFLAKLIVLINVEKTLVACI